MPVGFFRGGESPTQRLPRQTALDIRIRRYIVVIVVIGERMSQNWPVASKTHRSQGKTEEDNSFPLDRIRLRPLRKLATGHSRSLRARARLSTIPALRLSFHTRLLRRAYIEFLLTQS